MQVEMTGLLKGERRRRKQNNEVSIFYSIQVKWSKTGLKLSKFLLVIVTLVSSHFIQGRENFSTNRTRSLPWEMFVLHVVG